MEDEDERQQQQKKKKKSRSSSGVVVAVVEAAAAAASVSEWGPLVLPYLPPPSLATASLVCKTLHRTAAAITARRSSDATRGLERLPVPFRNPVDSQPYAYFALYTPSPVLSLPPLPYSWGGAPPPISLASPALPFVASSSDSGCACQGDNCVSGQNQKETGGNGSSVCPCAWLSPDFFAGSGPVMEVMTECGPSCQCGLNCGNRSTQGGIFVKLSVVKDRNKGWGLHAAQLIKKGTFVCEYAGEFLTTAEAQRRQKIYDSHTKFSPALLVVREHLPSGKACLRVNIDATRVGNVSRFINHSCDGGNLLSILVRNSGLVLPRLCFFAARNILEGEEISFSYGDVRLRQKGRICSCKTPGCIGILPSEEA